MFSKDIYRLASSIAVFLTLSGCESCFGRKPDPQKTVEPKTAAAGAQCLAGEASDKLMNRFYEGEVTAEEWSKVGECLVNSVEVFRQEIRPSAISGYTRQDIRNLVSKFFIKDIPVTEEFIIAIFDLKTSMFGGTNEVLANAEIDRIKDFLAVAKEQIGSLIPYFVKRRDDKSYATLLSLSGAAEKVGENIARALRTQGNPAVHRDTILTLYKYIGNLSDKKWGDKLEKDQADTIALFKVILVAGSDQMIEPEAWPRLALVGGSGLGLALASEGVSSDKHILGNAEYRSYLLELGKRGKSLMDKLILWHQGAIPLALLERLMDIVPKGQYPTYDKVDKGVIKRTVRAFLPKLLKNYFPDSVDYSALHHLFSMIEQWNRDQTHLETVFKHANLDVTGVSTKKFLDTAAQYAESLGERDLESVYRVTNLARNFRPLVLHGDFQVFFTAAKRQSLHNLTLMIWWRMAAEAFIKGYGTFPLQNRATLADIEAFVRDAKGILGELKLLDTEIPNIGVRHFANMNLFTQVSDGDDYIHIDELTYYIPLLVSTKMLASRVRDVITPICTTGELDPLGWKKMDLTCFRQEFYHRKTDFWDHFPDMIITYDHLAPENQQIFRDAVEKGARRFGKTELPVGGYDTEAMTMLLHYVESLFTRFDKDSNQALNYEEVMGAYPMFKQRLAEYGGIDPSDEDMLTTAFTFTVHYGRPPDKTNIKDLARFLWWKIRKDKWKKISAQRDILFKLISYISKPEAMPRNSMASAGFELENLSVNTELPDEIPEWRDAHKLGNRWKKVIEMMGDDEPGSEFLDNFARDLAYPSVTLERDKK